MVSERGPRGTFSDTAASLWLDDQVVGFHSVRDSVGAAFFLLDAVDVTVLVDDLGRAVAGRSSYMARMAESRSARA